MSFLTGSQVTTPPPSSVLGINPVTGLDTTGSIPSAYMSLFNQALAPTLAQAKESAGNLTGTGLTNNLGTAAGRSLSDFLVNMIGGGANRATQLAQGETSYQPGFLNYLFQGLGSAAPILSKFINPSSGGSSIPAGVGSNYSGPVSGDGGIPWGDLFNIGLTVAGAT